MDNNYSQYVLIDDDDSPPEENITRKAVRDRSRRNTLMKLLNEESQFLADFDPETSSRERRKLTRKTYNVTTPLTTKGTSLFDEKGRYRSTRVNVCDCLDNNCAGCHFPCPQCKSPKCAVTCRVNRKWAFELIEHDGKDLVLKNRNLK